MHLEHAPFTQTQITINFNCCKHKMTRKLKIGKPNVYLKLFQNTPFKHTTTRKG